jgi:hypothetical protein
MIALALTPFSERMLAALKDLVKSYEPHHCGGYTTDDMQWRMGIAFTPDETLFESLDELTAAGLIRIAGYDEESAINTCYEPE